MPATHAASSTEDETKEPRQHAEDMLAGSSSWYRVLFEQSLNGILLTDPQTGAILAANPEACRLLGYTAAEFRALDRAALVDTTDPRLAAAMETRARTGSFRGELTYRRADGTLLPVEVASSLLTSTNGATVASTIFSDISQRKLVEAALRESEEKWRSTFAFLPVGVSIVDGKHKVTDTNPVLAQILGLTEEGILKGAYAHRRYLRADHTLMPPEEFPSLRAQKEQRMIRDVEIGVETEDGAVVWTSVSATPMSGSGYAATVTVDITARKHVEAALRASEARLQAVIENTDAGIWSVDREYRLLVANGVFQRTIIAQLGRPCAPGESVLHRSFPPHVNAFWQAQYDRALAGETLVLEMASHMHRPGGTLEIHLSPILEDGVVTGVVGLRRDLTERKRMEAALQETNTSLEHQVAAARPSCRRLWPSSAAPTRARTLSWLRSATNCARR